MRMSLFKMSLSGAVIILAVLIVRALFINRLPKKTFVILWEIVLVRLLLPFTVPSVFSVYTLPPCKPWNSRQKAPPLSLSGL